MFREEFGQNPPPHEATTSEQEQFRREVVRPVLMERAQAVQQAAQGQGQQSGDHVQQEANEAFGRAYQVAVDMGLAEKGQTYQDYLDHQG